MKSIYQRYFKKLALFWAGSFILLVLVYMLIMAPQKKSKKHLEQQIAQKQQKYNSILKAAQEQTRSKLNAEIQRLRDSLESFVIDSENATNIIFDISQIASEKKVNSFSIKPKENDRKPAIPNCNYITENYIDISFTGSFKQFATFLNALERYQPVIFVDNFTITRSDQENSAHQVDMSLAFFVKKQQES